VAGVTATAPARSTVHRTALAREAVPGRENGRRDIEVWKSVKPAIGPVKNTTVENLLKNRGSPVENMRRFTYFFDVRAQKLAVALC
jgi:hypothetical protein